MVRPRKSPLRLVVNALALLCVIATAVGIAAFLTRDTSLRTRTERTRADLVRFQREINLRAVAPDDEHNAPHWPTTIDPRWFRGQPPRNLLISPDRPWLEIASPDQAHLTHPEVRVALDRSLASFWYNPARGIVRARVPFLLNDADTLDLYNRVNGTSLASLYLIEQSPVPSPPEAVTQAPAPP